MHQGEYILAGSIQPFRKFYLPLQQSPTTQTTGCSQISEAQPLTILPRPGPARIPSPQYYLHDYRYKNTVW